MGSKMSMQEAVGFMSDDELISSWREYASRVSYYNAAEGSCWSKEAKSRGIVKSDFYTINTELTETRNLGRPSGQYLL